MKTSCRTTASGAVMTMMMMKMMTVMVMMTAVSEAAAMPKESKSHRKWSEDADPMVTFPLQLDPEAFVPPGHLRPLNNVSISPWTYNVSRDNALFPPLLSEARCSLRGCLDQRGREDLSLRSRPILHQVLLLRRVRGDAVGDATGDAVYHYRLETRLVAVGCTCVRLSVHVQH